MWLSSFQGSLKKYWPYSESADLAAKSRSHISTKIRIYFTVAIDCYGSVPWLRRLEIAAYSADKIQMSARHGNITESRIFFEICNFF